MSLVDLSSDLSKFRSEVSREEKNTPEASRATNNKNFATFQPITSKLSQYSTTQVKRQEPRQLETKLGSTKLDDIKQKVVQSLLINSVSRYSNINESYNLKNLDNSQLETISSVFDDINQEGFVSKLTASKIVISRQDQGTNNLISPIELNIVENDAVDNIVNPNIQIERTVLSSDRTSESPIIDSERSGVNAAGLDGLSSSITNPNVEIEGVIQATDRSKESPDLSPARTVLAGVELDTPGGNVRNPNIPTERSTQTTDRTSQSPDLTPARTPLNGIQINGPNGNITNPNTIINLPQTPSDRDDQSPNIITETIQQGLVTNPDIKVIRIEQGTFHLVNDESDLNIDTKPIKFVTTSRLAEFEPPQDADTVPYDRETVQTNDNSNYNVDTIIRPNLSGRNENPEKSGLSIIGTQEVNFFPDSQARGFIVNTQPGVSYYTGESVFGWVGNRTSAPTTNFIDDVNARGFKKFATTGETDYNTESSQFGFSKPPETDFFDVTKTYVTEGFKTFVTTYQSAYKPDSSLFTWSGKREQSPETNFFDQNGSNSSAGFHKLAQLYDSKYIPNSSQFDWDGNNTASPETNFFDITNTNTSVGFHKFAQLYDSKYTPDSSQFDFDGNSSSGPETNFFDVSGANTSIGFHKFAQLYDSKYTPDSSVFDWDGNRDAAPEGNFFDTNSINSTSGFHKFAQLLESKFVPDSSVFDWDGNRENAPENNFFDITNTNTSVGFHKFAQFLDTKYTSDSSAYDWDGNRENAPETNFFDKTNTNTSVGFHKFAQFLDTKYTSDSSAYDWDGNRQQSPETNFFDVNKTNSSGFTKFVQTFETKYVDQSSKLDWDGNRQSSPETNFFDINNSKSSVGFHRLAELYDSKYIVDSSQFTWVGNKQTAPEVNQFDLTNKNTSKGFEKFAQTLVTKYVRDTSELTFKGSNQSAPEIDVFDQNKKYSIKGFERFPQKLVTKYGKDVSEYGFDGASRSAPNTNFFEDGKSTGFTTFAQKSNTEYTSDSSEFTFQGSTPTEVNFFPDTNSSGFTNKFTSLETKFQNESSELTFKGTTPDPVDFLSNTNASGFDIKLESKDTKFQHESSEFVFKGDGKSANVANFFGDTSATGFTAFPQALITEYIGESTFGIKDTANQSTGNESAQTSLSDKETKFSWAGSRQDAPEVDYLKIQGSNPDAISGFTKLFESTETKLTDEFSRFSFASVKNLSKIKNAPYTTFFGYNPSERTGFMTGMTTGESTLYPIIDPVLRYDEIPGRRFDIEGARAQRRRLKTTNLEKYAPLSLGKRPWADGTLSATLENQVPNILTGGVAGSSDAPYERGVKDNTERTGYLTKWAITRRSPSELDKQYSKFNLRNDSFNRDPVWSQPFVLRGLQGGLEPERWGGPLHFVDDGVARSGIASMVDRIIFDEQRIGKFLTSIKGLAWNLRQVGLQLMNPVVDINPTDNSSIIKDLPSTLTFNPLSVLANVATARVGFHIPRHGIETKDLLGANQLNAYEKSTISRETQLSLQGENATKFENLEIPTIDNKTNYNRLIGLMRELLPNSFKPSISPQSGTPADGNNSRQNNEPGSTEILRISSKFGGPNSFLGIGGTRIRKSSHPYLVTYTTSPDLQLQRQANYSDESKRDTFYANFSTYGDYVTSETAGGLINAITNYLLSQGGGDQNDPTVDQQVTSDNIQVSSKQKTIIQKLNPLNPKYDLPASNAKRITPNSAIKSEGQLSNSVNPLNQGKSDLIKQYRTANYDKLKKNDRRGSRFFNDFRADLDIDFQNNAQTEENQGRSFVTNPNIARYDTRNLSERYGFGDQGRVGVRRDQPFVSNIDYINFGSKQLGDFPVPAEKTGLYFRGDRINIIDFKRSNSNMNTALAYEMGNATTAMSTVAGTRDLIEFYFSSLGLQGSKNTPTEAIVFRASFGNITDNHKPSWNSVKYMGRADPLYIYQGYEREVSFDFTVHIGSRDEMRASWRKLNYLASWTAPDYTSAGYIKGPMIRLNIGHLYRKMPGYISSLSYTFDNTQTNWETAKLPEDMNLNDAEIKRLSRPGVLQLPKHIEVNVSFVPVGVYRPEYNGVMYNLYDDTTDGTSVETGLIPHNAPNRVNYFMEYTVGGDPVIYTGYENGKPYAARPIQGVALDTDPSNPEPDPPPDPGTPNPTDAGATAANPATAGTNQTSTTTQGAALSSALGISPSIAEGIVRAGGNRTGTGGQTGEAPSETGTDGLPGFLQGIQSGLAAAGSAGGEVIGGTTQKPLENKGTAVVPGAGNTTEVVPPGTSNPAPLITKTDEPYVKQTVSTLTPAATTAEEKIYKKVHSTVSLQEIPGTWPVTIWFKMRESEKNGLTPYPPGKDAAIAGLRTILNLNPDGTSKAEDFAWVLVDADNT